MRPALALAAFLLSAAPPALAESVMDWQREFPETDFAKRVIDLAEIRSDGATRDSIPPILAPRFRPVAEIEELGAFEPVISVAVAGDRRAYPLRILLWHEIVNDAVGGLPLLVSYCPLCNSGVVFDRRLGGRTLSFGNSGRLRHHDMVMYDHQTGSWWQQFAGRALLGDLAGATLAPLPARLESLARFRARAPDGLVLVPEDPAARPYGTTPYVGMEGAAVSAERFGFPLPDGVGPLERVVVVGSEAWPLKLLRERRRIEAGGLVLAWTPGQNSIHDTRAIAEGRDVGNVVVQRAGDDVPYDVAFAFAVAAFLPDGNWHLD